MPEIAKAATVVERVRAGVGGLVGRRPGPAQQTLTIASPLEEVADAWRDPAVLSQALGDAGQVEHSGEGRYRWALGAEGEEAVMWETVLVEAPGSLRWAEPGEEGGSEVVVELHEAPQGLGTEATLRLKLPVPTVAAGAMAFTMLYRVRALVQTGEVPTTTSQPSARPGDR